MLAILFIITGLFQGSHVRAQFFPAIEAPYARIEAEMPAGASAEVANSVRDKLINMALEFGKTKEDTLKGVKNPIHNFTSWMNGNTINIFFVLPSSLPTGNTQLASFRMNLASLSVKFLKLKMLPLADGHSAVLL